MTNASQELDSRRRRLLWRATHRGIREMDLLLGGYVSARIAGMAEDELRELEAIIEIPDQVMLEWATGQEKIPAERATPILKDILGLGR